MHENLQRILILQQDSSFFHGCIVQLYFSVIFYFPSALLYIYIYIYKERERERERSESIKQKERQEEEDDDMEERKKES